MKREELESLNLTEEQIEKVMGIHGKSTQNLQSELTVTKQKAKNLEADLNTANSTLEKLNKQYFDNDSLTKEIEDYKTRLEESEKQRQADKKTAFVELTLTKANAKNIKAVKSLLDMDKVAEKDGTYTGLDEQITALQESDGYLFGTDAQPQTQNAVQTGNPKSSETVTDEDKALFAGFDSY